VKFSVFIAGLRGRFVLKLYSNLSVTSQISVLKQIKEAILGTPLERLTISVTSAPFITENEVVCTNAREIKIVLTSWKNIAKCIMKYVN
jgi:hypothetical protein